MADMKLDALLGKLASGKPVPAILLYGEDVYLRKLCRDKLIETYVPAAARDWALARFSAADGEWDQAFGRAVTVPMLAPHQVVIVERVEAIDDLGEDARESAIETLKNYLADPAPFTVLVLEASVLDGRKGLSRLLAEKAVKVTLAMDSEQAAALAVSSAKEFGVELEPRAARLLVEAVNSEPARIRVEIEKLSLYAQAKGKISANDVEELVVSARKFTVWEMGDLLVESRTDAALLFLDGLLRDGEQPPMLVGALAWMYRKLIEAREIPPRMNKFQAARQLQMNPDSAERAMSQSRRFSIRQLTAGLAALADADSLLKSGVANPRASMEFLVTRLAAPSASSKSSAA